jgi:hypothetical protein
MKKALLPLMTLASMLTLSTSWALARDKPGEAFAYGAGRIELARFPGQPPVPPPRPATAACSHPPWCAFDPGYRRAGAGVGHLTNGATWYFPGASTPVILGTGHGLADAEPRCGSSSARASSSTIARRERPRMVAEDVKYPTSSEGQGPYTRAAW